MTKPLCDDGGRVPHSAKLIRVFPDEGRAQLRQPLPNAQYGPRSLPRQPHARRARRALERSRPRSEGRWRLPGLRPGDDARLCVALAAACPPRVSLGRAGPRHPPRGGIGKTPQPLYNSAVDTIKTLAHDRHFFTADVRLADYGQVLLIGDAQAVKRLLTVMEEHAGHDLVAVDIDEP